VSQDSRHDEVYQRQFERELLTEQAADLISEVRQSLALSQRELARRLDVSESRMSHVFAGRENLTLKTISDLGWAMGLRFELVPVPLEPDAPSPGTSEKPPPVWLRRYVRNSLRRIQAAWSTDASANTR
jgi:transcriptional regulator with XRE-family HTH domain